MTKCEIVGYDYSQVSDVHRVTVVRKCGDIYSAETFIDSHGDGIIDKYVFEPDISQEDTKKLLILEGSKAEVKQKEFEKYKANAVKEYKSKLSKAARKPKEILCQKTDDFYRVDFEDQNGNEYRITKKFNKLTGSIIHIKNGHNPDIKNGLVIVPEGYPTDNLLKGMEEFFVQLCTPENTEIVPKDMEKHRGVLYKKQSLKK